MMADGRTEWPLRWHVGGPIGGHGGVGRGLVGAGPCSGAAAKIPFFGDGAY